jgi:hypothetical protein
MRIIRNVEYVRRRKRIARLASLIGFLLLGSTFLLIFKPDYVLPAYAILFTGFIVFNFGMQQLGKWSRSPRNDEVLDARLKSLPDAKYTLIHFAKVGKRVVEHVLVTPGGLLEITARELPGKVSVKDKRWRKTGGGFTRFFAMSGPQLGNPSADLEQDVEALETMLTEKGLEADIYGAVVFLNERVDIEEEEPAYPVLRVEALIPFINAMESDDSFRQADREAVIAALAGGAGFEIEAAKATRRPVRVKRRVA